jgi:hypothetical protein
MNLANSPTPRPESDSLLKSTVHADGYRAAGVESRQR